MMGDKADIRAAREDLTPEECKRERLYQGTMGYAKMMLDKGIMKKKDYLAFETKMRAKYKPIFGAIFVTAFCDKAG